MKHTFWIADKKLAGRPGPNFEPWDLQELSRSGFTAILSVNDGELCRPDEIAAFGMEYAAIPLSENAPPQVGDRDICIANLPKALAFIQTHNRLGPVLVHCRSGKDRTGLVMAYYILKVHGVSPAEAMERVLKVRPIAFSAVGWIDFSHSILEELSAA